jgi:hypothetical protein
MGLARGQLLCPPPGFPMAASKRYHPTLSQRAGQALLNPGGASMAPRLQGSQAISWEYPGRPFEACSSQ